MAVAPPPPPSRARTLVFGAIVRASLALLMVVAWLDRALKPRLPFPRDPEALRRDPEWALAALRRAGAVPADARLVACDVHDFKSGEAFRSRVARVDVRWRSGDQQGATALLAKFAPRATSLRDHAVYIAQENHLKEVGVYARLADDPAVAAPRPYFAAAHKSSGNFCVLMERLDGAQEVSEAVGCPLPLAEQAMDAFAALHATYWGGDDPRASFLGTVPPPVIDWFATLIPKDRRAALAPVLRHVWRHDGEAPVTVLHGDARVGNMLFPGAPEGRFAFIDWQAARKGKAAFDVAYFAVLSLEPEVRRAHADALLDRYHAGLVARGVTGYTREALAEDYRLACVLVIAFVSLPFMSAEASTTDANTEGLRALSDAWARRARAMGEDLDLDWLATRVPGADPAQLRVAFGR